MANTIHRLKTWPGPFEATRKGDKLFEYRRDDRHFDNHDALLLQEWEPDSQQYTGREVFVMVTHVERGPAYKIPEGFCVMSLAPMGQRTVSQTSRKDGA